MNNRTPRRIFTMLLTIWVLSLLISLAPIFGWKDAQFVSRVQEQHVCLISQAISYQVFSTATAFYIPLCAIIIVYYKIMRAAKQRFKRERDRKTVNRNFDDKTRITKIVQHSDEQIRINTPIPCSNNNNKCGTPENGHIKFKVAINRHWFISTILDQIREQHKFRRFEWRWTNANEHGKWRSRDAQQWNSVQQPIREWYAQRVWKLTLVL